MAVSADTSFVVQAIFEADLWRNRSQQESLSYLERCQTVDPATPQAAPAHKFESAEKRSQHYRHVSQKVGGSFSNSAHGYRFL
jgi:hypothetical protein